MVDQKGERFDAQHALDLLQQLEPLQEADRRGIEYLSNDPVSDLIIDARHVMIEHLQEELQQILTPRRIRGLIMLWGIVSVEEKEKAAFFFPAALSETDRIAQIAWALEVLEKQQQADQQIRRLWNPHYLPEDYRKRITSLRQELQALLSIPLAKGLIILYNSTPERTKNMVHTLMEDL